MTRANLPDDFIFGTATASYQVEGAAFEGGRTSCIWDDYAKIPGAIKDGNDGRIAADQYHRYKEDVDLMAELGFDVYRFSISWSRVLPHGGKIINRDGIDYYKNLCNYLHEKGLKAVATIYHWDLPREIEDKGGWTNRETCYLFEYYASVLFEELGSLVDMWITVNEPYCIAYLGYRDGVHAPGRKNLDDAIKAVHHVLLAHALALKAYRKTGLTAPIGINYNPQCPRPATKKEEDKIAALNFRAVETEVFTGPVLGYGYPEYCTKTLGWKFPIEKGDMELIKAPIDFIAINYYNEYPVKYSKDSYLGAEKVPFWERTTDIGWPVDEKGLYRTLMWFKDYAKGIPLYVTENGSAESDILTPDKRVHDKERIIYFDKHLHAISDALKDGAPVKGYFAWSFIDNYEWAEGYTKRFGIVYCDYGTLKRYPKDSAYYLRDVIAGYGDF